MVDKAVAHNVLGGVRTQGCRTVTSVGAPIGQGRIVSAEVLLTHPAHVAVSARVDDVAHRNPIAHFECGDRPSHRGDCPDELVTGDHGGRVPVGRRVAHRVQVGMTDPAERDLYGDIVIPELSPLEAEGFET